jgi:pimeloyl-ACP methyl ester carboxylesterase
VATYVSYDGIEVGCQILGAAAEPLVCLPGGPLRRTTYFGDLGGLAAHRELILVQLPPRRVDQIVADVEALRVHLGRDRLDILAHSAAGSLALLYGAAHPERVNRLALITPTLRAAGIETSEDEWQAGFQRRSNEPWFADAYRSIKAWEGGDDSPANRRAAAPFFYGCWDNTAQAHAAAELEETRPDAAAIYYAEGAFDPVGTRDALPRLAAPVLLLVGELDLQPTLRAATELADLLPQATVAVQPGAGHYPWLDDPAKFVKIVTSYLD